MSERLDTRDASRGVPAADALPTSRPIALVTGGGGGLGSAICRALAGAGFRVVVAYREAEAAARSVAADLAGDGHSVVRAPVTDSGALAAAAAMVRERYGVLDALVNCAGTTRFVAHDDLDGLDDALIDTILSTNVRGPFAMVRAFHPLLAVSRQNGGGVVVNVSSIAARTAMGSNVMYCASKAALDNLTLSLARALSPALRVVSVAPGLVDTEFVKSMDPAWREEQVVHTPLARLAQPQEVAQAVVVAIRDLPFTTGCVLPVDGGRALR
ncbi:MAG: SDR family NAD(P)-dependent oxidoreductase [Janthinobacterium lividum]